MKRASLYLSLVLVGLMLPGCPIYGEDEGCLVDRDCPNAYVCDGSLGLCRPESDLSCDRPSDCSGNTTCSRRGICQTGDCSWNSIGCVAGYECSSDDGTFQCVREGSTGSGGSAGATGAEAGAPAASGGEGAAPTGTGGAT